MIRKTMPQVIKSAAVIMRLILSELNAPLISAINHNKAEIKDKKETNQCENAKRHIDGCGDRSLILIGMVF